MIIKTVIKFKVIISVLSNEFNAKNRALSHII